MTRESMLNRPSDLEAVGFKKCEHPLCECIPFHSPMHGYPYALSHLGTVKYCMTCAASLSDRRGWVGGFGTMHLIDYRAIGRYRLLGDLDFWLSQRPENRTFGDVS